MVGHFCLHKKDEITFGGADEEVHVEQRDDLIDELANVNVQKVDEVILLVK